MLGLIWTRPPTEAAFRRREVRRYFGFLVLSVLVVGVGLALVTWLRPTEKAPLVFVAPDGQKIQVDGPIMGGRYEAPAKKSN